MDTLAELTKFAGLHSQMNDADVGHLVIGRNEVVSSRDVEGLEIDVARIEDGVELGIVVREGKTFVKPVHMCFGLVEEEGVQRIVMDLRVEPRAQIDVVAHCIFPNAKLNPDGSASIEHKMDAKLAIGSEAHYSYFERHIHSDAGGLLVAPKSRVALEDSARFRTDFELIEGRVGVIDIDYETTCGPRSVLEMNARVRGRGDDRINIRETGHLAGENARGALTSRVAVADEARAEVYNKLTASAAGARGHVDCQEIIQGGGIASAMPIVEVSHPKAHVTHEAALGSVDQKQLQTLMARGLDEEAASDLIITGLLS